MTVPASPTFRYREIPNGGRALDGAFFALSMLLLLIGVIMVLSSSYARAYYDPGNVTGGNRRVLFRAAAYLRAARHRLYAAGVQTADGLLPALCAAFSAADACAADARAGDRRQGQRLAPVARHRRAHAPALGACKACGDTVLCVAYMPLSWTDAHGELWAAARLQGYSR